MASKEKNIESSYRKILVKANLQNYSFPKGSYKEEYLGHLIRIEDYNGIIESASKILSQAWMKKRENDKINLPSIVVILSVIAVVLTIIYMILIYYSTTEADATKSTIMLVVSGVCVVSATIIAFSLSIYNFCREMGQFKTIQDIIREDLENLFKLKNTIYSGKLKFSYNEPDNTLIVDIEDPIQPRESVHDDERQVINKSNKEIELGKKLS